MSQAALESLVRGLGSAITESGSFRGDEFARVKPENWLSAATFLRSEPTLAFDHFVDLTAVDFPEREGGRFELVLFLRSLEKRHRIQIKTWLAEGQDIDSLMSVWAGANWAEREVFDMFGIRFRGHSDLRRILLYDEFEGHPLRKDYPIDRAQPLVPYRDTGDLEKLPPFGVEEGQPFGRIRWHKRLEGRDLMVAPAIAVQTGQRANTSQSSQFVEAEQADFAADFAKE